MKKNIYQVDVFSTKPFEGNPAGVVADARGLSAEDMQNIAKEMNLSETAFIFPIDENNFKVRFFTPISEVDICGHGTIGSFYTLAYKGYIPSIKDGIKTLFQETKAGKLSVDISFKNGQIEDILMEQSKPKILDTIKNIEPLLDSFNIREKDIGIGQEFIYPRIVSTGLTDILLPIKNKETLDNLNVNFKKLEDISEKLDVIGVHVFYLPKKSSKKVYVRNFAPLVGIDEEAATGTANGALIYFLKDQRYIEGNKIIAIQGESLNRSSKIYCKIDKDNGEYIVKVGGQARIVLEGVIYC